MVDGILKAMIVIGPIVLLVLALALLMRKVHTGQTKPAYMKQPAPPTRPAPRVNNGGGHTPAIRYPPVEGLSTAHQAAGLRAANLPPFQSR